MKKSAGLKFSKAFDYPFNKAKRMFNILWMFFPIFGWFALGGYSVRIVQGFTKGKFKEMPAMKFWKDFNLGFMMFLKALPFVVVMVIAFGLLFLINPVLEAIVEVLFGIFAAPILFIHFMNRMTIESLFEFRILSGVWNNMGDYLTAILKSIGLGLIFVVMMIVFVGFPAGQFTKNIFLADFYRRNVK
ncbi:DUF4013 domain-containing protein [Methanococcoides sp. SA1]|nr:DUF4013 domain-containing protein [Methanococcoides sp. SA1]